MAQIQLRLTPDQAELIAAKLTAGHLVTWTEEQLRELEHQAARLNYMVTRARNRAAHAENH